MQAVSSTKALTNRDVKCDDLLHSVKSFSETCNIDIPDMSA